MIKRSFARRLAIATASTALVGGSVLFPATAFAAAAPQASAGMTIASILPTDDGNGVGGGQGQNNSGGSNNSANGGQGGGGGLCVFGCTNSSNGGVGGAGGAAGNGGGQNQDNSGTGGTVIKDVGNTKNSNNTKDSFNTKIKDSFKTNKTTNQKNSTCVLGGFFC